MNDYAIGIDIGSTCAKAVVLSPSGEILRRLILPTGWSSVDTAKQIETQLSAFLPFASVAATGYGRVCVPYANRQITEITCHARGGNVHIRSMCTVFAESGAVGLIGRGNFSGRALNDLS